MAEIRSWFPFYPADWVTNEDVVDMSLAERGAYLELLCHQWRNGSIPDDMERLRKIARCTAKEMTQVWPKVSPMFPPADEDGRLANGRMSRERVKAEAISVKSSTSAEKRWRAHKPDANALPVHSEGNATKTNEALSRGMVRLGTGSEASSDQSEPSPTTPTHQVEPPDQSGMAVVKIWNRIQLEGVPPMHNPHALLPVAEALSSVRTELLDASKPCPGDAEILLGLARRLLPMARAGLNVWQPKTMARYVGDAVLVALGKMDPEAKPSTPVSKFAPPEPPKGRPELRSAADVLAERKARRELESTDEET